MELIPVLDLKAGVVVHARMGQRQSYQPIATPLSPTSDPVDVMGGLLTIHPFQTFYVADLDAIGGRGDNRASLARLRSQFGVGLWVDNGVADVIAARRWLDEGLGHLVLGSETQRDAALVRELACDPRISLSLDFRADAFQGPPALLAEAQSWPHRVIVMSLSRVGSGAGPDLDRLGRIQKDAGAGRKIYAAGGVRDPADLKTLQRAGVAGALVASCLHEGRVTGKDIVAVAI